MLNDFVRLDANPGDGSFEQTLRAFRTRFSATNTEEGRVMAIAITYVLGTRASHPPASLNEYRSSQRVQTLFQRGVRERDAAALPKGSPN